MRAAAPGMGMVVIGVVWVGVVKTFAAAGVWTAAGGGAEVEATGGAVSILLWVESGRHKGGSETKGRGRGSAAGMSEKRDASNVEG